MSVYTKLRKTKLVRFSIHISWKWKYLKIGVASMIGSLFQQLINHSFGRRFPTLVHIQLWTFNVWSVFYVLFLCKLNLTFPVTFVVIIILMNYTLSHAYVMTRSRVGNSGAASSSISFSLPILTWSSINLVLWPCGKKWQKEQYKKWFMSITWDIVWFSISFVIFFLRL